MSRLTIVTFAGLALVSGALGKEFSMADVTVSAEGGNFYFTHLAIGHRGLSRHFTGEVQNRTGRMWSIAKFYAAMQDGNGRPIHFVPGTFMYSRFGPDETRKFDYVLTGRFDMATLTCDFSAHERTPLPEFKFTRYNFSLVEPTPSGELVFEDDYIRVQFTPGRQEIALLLTNKMPDAIKIDWNQCSLVEPNGVAQKVVHRGVRYIERNSQLPPSMIPPNAKLEDFIVPSERLYYSDTLREWSRLPLFSDDLPKARDLVGQHFSLFFPLEANGVMKQYNFVFKIDDVSELVAR